MKMPRFTALCAALGLVIPGALIGQQGNYFRSSVLYESYTFGDGFVFNKASQLSVPFGASVRLGKMNTFAVSSGYTRVEVETSAGTQTLSGMLDTQARWGLELISGQLIVLFTGTIPTGQRSLAPEDQAVLGAISSDVIGFSSPSVGSGGDVGGGIVGAIPLGRWALGFGATFNQPVPYQPLEGTDGDLRPGREFRFRGGLEGPLGRRTYLRLAGIFARRSNDQVRLTSDAWETRNGVGNRITGYLALNQSIGNASLTVYGIDVFRSDPQIEPTAVGAAALPRGNLIASGLQIAIPIGATTTIMPKGEFRASWQAPDASTTSLDKAGQTMRFGMVVEQRLTPLLALVVQGSGLTGTVYPTLGDGTAIDVSGYRFGANIRVTP
jgi:hypothetical protein